MSTAARARRAGSRSSATSSRRSRSQGGSTTVATGLMVLAVGMAPLAVGGVHRPILLSIGLVVLVATCVVCLSEWQAGGQLRITQTAVFPAAFMILTAVQLIPLPPAIIDRLDPSGASLLSAGDRQGGIWRPLSLDPPSTIEALARAVVAFLVFLICYHLAAKRNSRSWTLRVVAAAGVAAVIIGLGHRVFAVPKIYGLFQNGRQFALLTGPFINPNHTAEFLELATFVGIACARRAVLPLERVGWYSAAVVCAAGALATLSRSSVFALAVGVAVLIVGRAIGRQKPPEVPARRTWLPVVAGLLAFGMVAFSIGADQLFDRFRAHSAGQDMRLGLWRDSLTVLGAHPWGIGRGAFDVVYPIYRTLAIGRSVRFSFVENQPLQLLIDFGYLGFILLACAAIVSFRVLVKHGRRDGFEMALLAGLLSVAAHSVTDFGLETLGIALPCAAVLGTMLGRNHRFESPSPSGVLRESTTVSTPRPYVLLAASGLGLGLVSLCSVALGSGRNFDTELAAPLAASERRALIAEARRAHPLDYYFPLQLSTMEPLIAGQHSPRLRALNQALLLCRNCPEVHLQVARTMWKLGRRSQALVEWNIAARGQAALFRQSIEELSQLGASAMELSRLAGRDAERLLEIATFLLRTSRLDEAKSTVAAASDAGASPIELGLLRARIFLAASDLVGTEKALTDVAMLAPQDPRLALLQAECALRKGGSNAPSTALAIVETSLDRDPGDLDLQRKRIEIVSRFERWSVADRAILGFKQALLEGGQSLAEANLAAADIYRRLGRVREEMAEYGIATTADPTNVTLWRQFASSAENGRHYVLAREAYAAILRIEPTDKQASESMRRIDDKRTQTLDARDPDPSLRTSPVDPPGSP